MTSNKLWPIEREEQLRKLFAEKRSAGEIAAEMGGLSRNAVCGKLARLGLVRGYGPRHPDKPVQKKRTRKPKAPLQPGAPKFNPELFVCAEAVDVVPRHLTIDDLEEGDCRYPYGDGPFTFCGHRVVIGKSYCPAHSQLVFQTPKPMTKPGYIEFGRSAGGVFRRTA